MTTFGLVAVLQLAVLASGDDTYAEAYRTTTQTGRPMVVMVGAEWCSACNTMEKQVIPQVRRRGLLGRVAFAAVNLDRERNLGRKLTRGGPIPQLLMFRKTRDGWRLSRLVGGQSVRKVEAFIDAGLKRHEKANETPPEEQAASQESQTADNAGDAAASRSKS